MFHLLKRIRTTFPFFYSLSFAVFKFLSHTSRFHWSFGFKTETIPAVIIARHRIFTFLSQGHPTVAWKVIPYWFSSHMQIIKQHKFKFLSRCRVGNEQTSSMRTMEEKEIGFIRVGLLLLTRWKDETRSPTKWCHRSQLLFIRNIIYKKYK